MNTLSGRTLTGAGLLGLGLLSLAPFPILGPALGWPATLDDPASAMLPRLAAHLGSAQLGYGLYLLYSLMYVGAIAALIRLAGRSVSVLGTVAIALAAVSSLARSLGILRWLSVMPDLAQRYVAGDPESQKIIAIQFEAFNHYAGATGEMLGVGVFAGMALIAAGIALWRSAHAPRWVAASALIVGLIQVMLIGSLLGIPGSSVMIASSAVNLWLMAIGIWLMCSKAPAADLDEVWERRSPSLRH